MAKIKEIDTQSGRSNDARKQSKSRSAKGTKRGAAAAPSAISPLIFILPLITIAVGTYAHYTSVHQAPGTTFGELMKLSPSALKAQLGVSPFYLQRYDVYLPEEPYKFVLSLNIAFADIISSNLGRGIFAIIMSAASTPFGAMYLDAPRPGYPWSLNRGIITFFALIGQGLMIGFVIPAFYVPLFAFVSWRQATKDPQTIRPLPSPPSSQVIPTILILFSSFVPFFWLMFVPPSGQQFFWASTAFQFFPLLLLPTLLIRPVKPEKTPPQPRLAAARAYSLFGYISVPMYWYGLYKAVPTLLLLYRKEASWPDSFTRLLFYDTLSLTLSFYVLVLLQAEIDLRAVQCNGPRVHRARLFIEDVIFGTVGLLIMGPGFGMGTYYARREILAEKARFGIAPDFAMSPGELEELDQKSR